MKQSDSACGSCADKSGCSEKGCPSAGARPGEAAEQQERRMLMQQRLGHIRNKILVMSGKGGVGKSSTAVNLAMALAQQGHAVGLVDVDIHGPSVPKMLGLEGVRPKITEAEDAMLPVNYEGLKVMSIGFMLEKDTDAVIWRGAMKAGVIQQFLADVEWGYLDYLVVDCPPGTGDEPLSVAQFLGTDAQAVIVTTPQEVALNDVRKSITFCHQLKMNLLGVVENMSGFVCPHCNEVIDLFKKGGGRQMAEAMGAPFLGAVPVDPDMVNAGDSGKPVVLAHPESEISKALQQIAQELVDKTA